MLHNMKVDDILTTNFFGCFCEGVHRYYGKFRAFVHKDGRRSYKYGFATAEQAARERDRYNNCGFTPLLDARLNGPFLLVMFNPPSEPLCKLCLQTCLAP